jgi:hypothetical protein
MGKIEVGKYVKVVKGNDDTFDEKFLGMEGLVVGHNDNRMTGNTTDDPLHDVSFDLNTVPKDHPQYDIESFIVESFWSEELEVTNKNFIKS